MSDQQPKTISGTEPETQHPDCGCVFAQGTWIRYCADHKRSGKHINSMTGRHRHDLSK